SYFVERHHERKHDANVAVYRRAKERSKLRAENVRRVETHSDRPPAEEGIRFGRVSADRQLVAADVERSNDDRFAAKGLGDATIGVILLVLVRHARPPDDEKLRPHQPDALGAA